MNSTGTPIKKKICMLGASGVGKTSLVKNYVYGSFSDGYRTTIGVAVHGIDVTVDGQLVELTIMDLEGCDDPLQEEYKEEAYMRDQVSQGYVLVIDGTRSEITFNVARTLQLSAQRIFGCAAPFVVFVNKCDLLEEWAIPTGLSQQGWTVYETSAKTGKNVPEAFQTLVRKMREIDEKTTKFEGDKSTPPSQTPDFTADLKGAGREVL